MRHLGGILCKSIVGTEVEEFFYFYVHPVYYFNMIIIGQPSYLEP